jgi:hypothetical protein
LLFFYQERNFTDVSNASCLQCASSKNYEKTTLWRYLLRQLLLVKQRWCCQPPRSRGNPPSLCLAFCFSPPPPLPLKQGRRERRAGVDQRAVRRQRTPKQERRIFVTTPFPLDVLFCVCACQSLKWEMSSTRCFIDSPFQEQTPASAHTEKKKKTLQLRSSDRHHHHRHGQSEGKPSKTRQRHRCTTPLLTVFFFSSFSLSAAAVRH